MQHVKVSMDQAMVVALNVTDFIGIKMPQNKIMRLEIKNSIEKN